MVSHPKTPTLNCFYHLLWVYFLTVSEFSCLAKSYSVSDLTPMPHIPNQHHYTKRVHMKCLMLPWRLESVQLSYKVFCIIHLSLNLCVYTCFVYLQLFCVTLDFKLFIDSIHNLFLLYLLLWFWDFTIKNLQDFIKVYRALIKDIFLLADPNLDCAELDSQWESSPSSNEGLIGPDVPGDEFIGRYGFLRDEERFGNSSNPAGAC